MIIDLKLNDRNILVVGAGIESTKRVKSMINYDCKITVISETIDDSMYEIKENHNLRIIKRKIQDTSFLDEFNDLFMVFASTDNSLLNRKIVEKAKKKRILTYCIDDSTSSDFFFTSIINIEKIIQVAISTSGKSPLMNKIIREKVENAIKNIIGKKDIDNIKIQEFTRQHAKGYISSQHDRKEFLYSLIYNEEIQELLAKNNIDKVKERIIKTLDKWEDYKNR